MKIWLMFGVLLYASEAYTQDAYTANNLCRMDIEPGIFENKLVPGGTYIYDTTAFQTAEECMTSCCNQSMIPYNNQLPCNMAYYYQEIDPYNVGVFRNVCVWWNCKPGECQPNRDVDPNTAARVGFIVPQSQPQQIDIVPEQNYSIPRVDEYGGDQPGYQYQAAPAAGQQQPATGYQPGYEYQVNQASGVPEAPLSSQYNTVQALPTNQFNQPVSDSQYGEGEVMPLTNATPSGELGNGEFGGSEQSWIYDPATGQYVLVNTASSPDGVQQTPAESPLAELETEPTDNYIDETELLSNQPNRTQSEEKASEWYTSTPVAYTTTENGVWFWQKWWNNEDDDDDNDDDVNGDSNGDDYDYDKEWDEAKQDSQTVTNNWESEEQQWEGTEQNDTTSDTNYWYENDKEEEEWEKEEEQLEEQEWEKEMEVWEDGESNGDDVTQSSYYTTTLSEEEIAMLQEEESEEEKEIEDWLESYEDTEEEIDQQQPQQEQAVATADEEFYKPETFSQSVQSDWSVNVPVIVIGTCAAVVLIALVFILVGKKLAGRSDRAQYRPLRESFSGSSTYHEDI